MQPPGKRNLLTIDGTLGEGGGQILRTSLALSLCLGKPFRMTRVRAHRKKPGLQPQHLAAVKAAAEIGAAEVEGDVLGSGELTFAPQAVQPGHYRFATGTAGSATLVLQTVLPALLTAGRPSRLELSGGTHNPLAPSFDFLELAYLPLINRMGPRVTARLRQPGFYPVGGGVMEVEIEPAARLAPLQLDERGEILEQTACALVSRLPLHIAQRELDVIGTQLGLPAENLEAREITTASGPGNVVTVVIRSRYVTEVFAGFGMRGIRAEKVAAQVVERVRRYLAAGVPVGEQLADQLLLPLALAGGGSYVTLTPSRHTTTNGDVIRQFMTLQIDCRELGPDRWRIELHHRGQ
jgi:RNA 3'-terminal phosphate cyclase (ATP)